MNVHNYPRGELCLQTPAARTHAVASGTDKATATDADPIMSAQERRFWAKVNKNGPVNPRRPELGPCWLWTGSSYTEPKTGARSYGQTSYQGRRISAHRTAFLMAGGTIPAGREVMHLCDTKPCVRYSHLTAGTHSENMLDGFANPANQGVCAGENNGRARLTWDDIHAIRATPKVYGRQPVLAEKYGVSQAQISQILADKKWPEAKCPIHGTVAERAA